MTLFELFTASLVSIVCGLLYNIFYKDIIARFYADKPTDEEIAFYKDDVIKTGRFFIILGIVLLVVSLVISLIGFCISQF